MDVVFISAVNLRASSTEIAEVLISSKIIHSRMAGKERRKGGSNAVVLPLRITAIRAATGLCALSIAELGPCLVVKKKAHIVSQLGFLSVNLTF